VAADIENPDDIGVVERSGSASLAQKAFGRESGVVILTDDEDLDGHLSVQVLVFGQVHRAHPAATDLVEDDVLAQPEPLVAALHELLGLELGDDILVDQNRDCLAWVIREFGDPRCCESGWGRNPAPVNQIE
jgi:hypothetical protein